MKSGGGWVMSGRDRVEVLGVVLPGEFAADKVPLVSVDPLPPVGAEEAADVVEDVGAGPGVEPGAFATGVEPVFALAASCFFWSPGCHRVDPPCPEYIYLTCAYFQILLDVSLILSGCLGFPRAYWRVILLI